MTTPAIAVRGLSKRHGDHLVVDDVTFDVRSGSVTCLGGPNGAGKSSTLRLIAGLDRPNAGQVLVHGRALPSWPEPGRVLGAAFDGRAAHPGRTAIDSLRWVARLAGVPEQRCADLLHEVGLAAVARRRTRTFSLGMHRRLALAIALLPEPEVLVLDEPLNGLDPEGVAWFRSLLGDLRSRGCTVLMVSHAIADVADLVDDVVTMRDGRVNESGPAEKLWRHRDTVRVCSDDPQRLAAILQSAGGRVVRVDDDFAMHIGGLESGAITRLATAHGLTLTGRRENDA